MRPERKSYIAQVAAIVVVASLSSAATAYELPTHQAITRRAADRSVNLANFLADFALDQREFSRRFQNLAQAVGDDTDGDVTIAGRDAHALLESGAVLEDGDRRFFNHFYDPQYNRGYEGDYSSVLCPLFGCATSKEWGRNGRTAAGGTAKAFSYERAFDDFRSALTAANQDERDRSIEEFLVTLGQVVHLIQDAAQPSHTRNDGHGSPRVGESVLEKRMRYLFADDSFIDLEILVTLERTRVPYIGTYDEFFDSVALISNEQFFSDDTFFDSQYDLPSQDTTRRRTERFRIDTVEFLVSTELVEPLTRQELRLGHVPQSFLGGEGDLELSDDRDLVVRDNGQVLITVAVVASAAFLNFFLRGRLEVSLDPDSTDALVVRNVSDTQVLDGKSVDLLRFDGGVIEVFYETSSGKIVKLDEFRRENVVLAAGSGEIRIPGVASRLAALGDARDDGRIVVLYDGVIGQERGVAAAEAFLSTRDLSVLLSFDTSGSIGTQDIEIVKDAGRRILSLLENGGENRVAVHAFSSTAEVLQDFSGDIASASGLVDGLRSSGDTALIDALVLAGTACTTEAQGQPSERNVVLVLFTDGLENSSNASDTDAIAAIDRIEHPEIDEVFLVFVGDDPRGARALSDLAARAGREIVQTVDFQELARELLNLAFRR